jgi:hypothetical protein
MGTTYPVQAATKPQPYTQPLAALQQMAGAPKDPVVAGLPPNLDWSIFLPQGEGQFQAQVYCVTCHSTRVTVTRRSDAAGWNQIVHRMIDMHQAAVQAEDAATLVKYFTEVLSPTTPALNLPLHINTVPKEELNFLGMLPPEALQKIVDARAKGKIKDFPALQAIVGDKTIDKYKDVLVFD